MRRDEYTPVQYAYTSSVTIIEGGRDADRVGAWALYRLAESQGLVDLLLVGSAAPDESPQEVLHLLVCADLSRRSEDFGLSVVPFPQRYR